MRILVKDVVSDRLPIKSFHYESNFKVEFVHWLWRRVQSLKCVECAFIILPKLWRKRSSFEGVIVPKTKIKHYRLKWA